MKPVLYMTVGIPASGKSYWAAGKTKDGVHHHSSDDIRKELGLDQGEMGGGKVFELLAGRVRDDLRQGFSVIYDATCMTRKRRMAFLESLKNIDCEKRAVLFLCPLAICRKRNSLRDEFGKVPAHTFPGMLRSFACENYAFTDQNQLKQIREQVKSEFEIDRIQNIAGSDIDDNALVLARRHIHQAGLDGHIQVHRQDLASLTMDLTNGVFLCNPPYGERMGDQKSCRRLYAAMGKLFRRNPTWSMTVIATDPAFEEFFGMKADKRRRVYNGRLECQILTFFAK